MKKALLVFSILVGLVGNSGAQGCVTCGSSVGDNDDVGPNFNVSLGAALYGESAGMLTFESSQPNRTLFTPQALQFTGATRTDVVAMVTNVVSAILATNVETDAVLTTNIITQDTLVRVAGSRIYTNIFEAVYGPGFAVDSAGDLYVADPYHNVVRKIAVRTGAVSTIAGNGSGGYSGDGGAATNASLNYPCSVALDGAGNIYIADFDNSVIRKITASTSIISTVAGNNSPGYSGDGGAATSAQLYLPLSVSIDSLGNLYIVDCFDEVVRKVTASTGIITTVAGNGSAGYSGDGFAATSATLNIDQTGGPCVIAVDGAGNLYIPDTDNNVIRKVTASTGIISTVAGNGGQSYFGDGGMATNANFYYPCVVALDGSTNLYIADCYNNAVRKVIASTGIITTVAGNNYASYSGDGGAATNASIEYPIGLACDNLTNLFIADGANEVIRVVTGSSGIINTLALNGLGIYNGDGGTATNASLNSPSGIAANGSGDIYIADTYNNAIRKLASSGIITTVTGTGHAGYSGNGGAATSATLTLPFDVAADSSGNLYVADSGNHVIRKVTTSTGIITTVAGNGSAGYTGNGGTATSAELDDPSGVAMDSSGNLYIADTLNHVIRKVTTGGTISTVAGNGSMGYSGDGAAATSAKLNYPSKVAVDASGNLYIADTGNNVIRKVTSGGTISTVAGNGSAAYSGDGGAATSAQLNSPLAVIVDSSGNLYIADTGNDVIREVTPAGIITTAVTRSGAYNSYLSLNSPGGMALDSLGNLFVADTGNNLIAEVASSQNFTNYNFNEVTTTNVTSTSVTNAVIRQVLTPQILADIPTPTANSGYVINFYYPTNISGTNMDGTCQISGTPFITWMITNSNPSANFQLQISEFGISPSYGLIKQITYNYTNTTGAWSAQSLGGIVENTVTTNLNGNIYQVVNTLQSMTGSIAQQTVKTYQTFNWAACTNVALVTNTIGAGMASQTTTYTYWDPATFSVNGINLPKTVIHADGSWEYYTSYDNLGRPLQVYSAFQDAAVNDTSNGRETDYTYDPASAGLSGTGDNGTLNIYNARQVISKVQGHEVSRQYNVFPSAGLNYSVQCTALGAAWNAAGNLITTNLYYTNGVNQFRSQNTLNPDGTISAYNYITNGLYETNIIVTGQPGSAGTNIIDGVSNVVVLNIQGYIVMDSSYDVVSGLALKHNVYGNFDSYGRSQQVSHLDGTTEYTTYICCGVDTTVDRDGLATVYLYDADKRQLGYEKIYSGGMSNAISYENTLDAASRTIQSYRVGADGSTIMTSQSAYDTAGELTFQTNALNGVTAYTQSHDPMTSAWIRTTTNPDGGVITSYYYADGSLKKTIGTGTHGQSYGYGYAIDVNGNTCTYSVQTNLDNSGNLTGEWTKTYTDMAGRNTETLYADGDYSQSFYNAQSQLSKQIDPDGVVTLHQYNAKGEMAYTAVDMNRNGAIDFSGTDRITQTSNDVITDHSTTVRRSQNYVWLDGQSVGTLVSSTESSADGLNTWYTQYRDTSTPVTSHSQTVPGISKTVTSTAPDNSYTANTYSYGRLISSTRYGSTGSQIIGTTVGYDAHGRQNTTTDARNGTTTLGFNNADLVATNTTPNPDGGSPETTVTLYDTMLRAYNVIQPDGTAVASTYLLTGELGLQYGSRTYPVGYSYDYAGRMQTMTNWSSFSTLAGSRVTTWNYDGQRGWLTSKAYPDGHGPSYTYTGAGRLVSRLWVRGITTSYAYDNAGTQTNVSYSDSTPAAETTYDRLGRPASIVRNGMTDTITYNLGNQLLGESFSGGTLNGLSITNGYDADLRRTTLAALASGSQLSTATYGYDNASRLASVTDGNNNSAVYSYLANSPLVSQIAFKQSSSTRMTTTKNYDYLNRLTQISSAPSASYVSPLTFNYNYNPANQRTKDTLADGSYWNYGYDFLGQVTNACKYWANGTPVAGQQFDYTFDTIGNRLQTLAGGDTNGLNLRVANYTNNTLNQITSRDVPPYVDVIGASILTNTVTVNGQAAYRNQEYFRQQLLANNSASALWTNVIVAGGQSVTGSVYVAKSPETFSYDADGNLANDGRWTYVWDGENRLVQMTVNTNVGPQYKLTFAYDSKGRRIQKIVATNSVALSTNNFLYDGWNLVAELKPNNTLIRSYVWGSDLSGSPQGSGGVGGLLEVSYYGSSTTNCFPAFDGNGNLSALINTADGTIAANYEYAVFGEPIRITGTMAKINPFRFATKYNDDESDLLYYGYRYYKASTGNWLSRDLIEELGGKNIYEFVNNNPENKIDRLGLIGDPGPDPNGFMRKCPYCNCKAVKITGKPKTPPGLGYYLIIGAAKYGNLMSVAWTVDGDPTLCKFEQNETGYTIATSLSGASGPKLSNYGLKPASQSYNDYMGIQFSAPDDNGDWDILFDLHIDFLCTSSNGKKMTGAHLDYFQIRKLHW